MTDAAADLRATIAIGGDIDAPRVSVVMPFRDAGGFIEEAVRSVLDQTYRRLELIALDDGSSDNGPEIVERIAQSDSRVRLIREGARGFVRSVNRGVELARGEYIARMDADDACLPERLAQQVAFLDAAPDVGVVGGQILAILDDATVIPPWWIDNPLEHDAIVQALAQRNSIYHPTALIRRSVLEAVGGYRPAFTVVQDYDLWLRLAERTRLANLPNRVLRYRFHSGQATERNMEQAYLCTWSARYAAHERRSGRPDPIRQETRIDRSQTLTWGLNTETVDAEIAWIRASHRARAHLLRGRRIRAALAFVGLLAAHPGPFLRRTGVALRSRLARRGDSTEPSPPAAWPASR